MQFVTTSDLKICIICKWCCDGKLPSQADHNMTKYWCTYYDVIMTSQVDKNIMTLLTGYIIQTILWRLFMVGLWQYNYGYKGTYKRRLCNVCSMKLLYLVKIQSLMRRLYGQTVVIKRWLDYDNKIRYKQRVVNDVTLSYKST